VYNYGNGTSLCEGLIQNFVVISDVNCVKNFFNKSCAVYFGDIEITMSNAQGLSGEAYIQPDIATSLNNIGLGSLTVIAGGLTVYATHTPYPLPTPIAPVFLADLRQALNILVFECEDCSSHPEIPSINPSRLTALAGLQGVVQLNGPNSFAILEVSGTAFQDLTSFSGLACVELFAYLIFINNHALQSFDGLEAVQPLSNGGILNAIGSGPFSTAASVAALRSLAGCDSGSSPEASVSIPKGCNQQITSLAEICTYQGVVCR
jgi:hypothetical protein